VRDLNVVSGTIFDIQRYSVHDGPGIRTLIFLKGCPLRCKWCCNPESYIIEPQEITVNGESVITGRDVTVGEVMDTILKDMIYYRRSNGGVTLSGGEPLFQPEFASSLLQACKLKDIHTAIETTASAKYDAIEKLLPWLDLLMVDIKHMSDKKHMEFTGVSNKPILKNARRLAKDSGVQMAIRVPVVPGFNDTPDEISEIASFAATLPGVKRIHLLPYHRLGQEKYEGLGMEYYFSGVEPMSQDTALKLQKTAKRVSGLECLIGG